MADSGVGVLVSLWRRVAAYAAVVAWVLTLLPWLGPSGWIGAPVALTTATVTAAGVTMLAAWRSSSDRLAWWLLGGGLTGYAGGFVIQFYFPSWQHVGSTRFNLSDRVSLLLYPAGYAGLLLLVRSRATRRDGSSVVEGAIVLTGAASVAIAAVGSLYPALLHGSVTSVVYALAYPVGGFTLLTATLSGLAVTGWRIDRGWMLLVTGYALMTAGDGIYGLQSAAHHFHYGTPLDSLYTAGPLFTALAAVWTRPATRPAPRQWRPALFVPVAAALGAIAVLVGGDLHRIPTLAIILAAGCVLLSVTRTLLLFRQTMALEHTKQQARTDELTGLPNRRALMEQLRHRLPSPERRSNDGHREAGSGELLLLDLDRFKEVNDSLGHAAGDALLTAVANRLSAACLDEFVARLGGDEFAILLTTPLTDALTERVRSAVSSPMDIAGTRIVIEASMGCAAFSDTDGLQQTDASGRAGELLRRADVALYAAKRQRQGCAHWRAALDVDGRQQFNLLSEFREALAVKTTIRAAFQPKKDPISGRTTGWEALVRWQHPDHGLMLPASFLPMVERAGLMNELTKLMLEQSLQLLQEIQRSGLADSEVNEDKPLEVAVNLSASDLLDTDFPGEVRGQLEKYGVPPSALRLEVTESVVMSDPTRILQVLNRLRTMGVRLSLDDYGTGLSSLTYLRDLPIDELKIDRSFVGQILTDSACAIIVASTVRLAHELGMAVVAEGVESEAVLQALAASGCNSVQGWHVGTPLPHEELLGLMRQSSIPQPRGGHDSAMAR